jgi:N-acetyl-beta-hexosaminidase
MKQGIEKFIIQMTEKGVTIRSGKRKGLHFTASEALMLLDILRNEETRLARMAREASPLPMRITLTRGED